MVELLAQLRNLFSQHVIFGTGILLISGYIMGKIAEKIHLPSITGYIIAGLALGESCLALIPSKEVYNLNAITEIALGLIALTIGAEFELTKLRRTGKAIVIITVTQAVFAFVCVAIAMLPFGVPLPYALLLGAIATATAPAATVIIVRELRARGEFIDYLYGVVALDDAICIVVFSIVFTIITPLFSGVLQSSIELAGILAGFTRAMIELTYSALLGMVAGIVLHYMTRKRYKLNEVLIIAVATIFITTSLAIVFHLSLLIANMVLGAVVINISYKNRRIFHVIEPITPPVFALFFILAGTEVNMAIFVHGIVILYGIVFTVSRFIGKYSGSYLSALVTRSSSNIRNYLGFCLFPQAGVAIGLVLLVQTSPVVISASPEIREYLIMIINVVLFSVFLNELIGPLISRYGIIKGAELK